MLQFKHLFGDRAQFERDSKIFWRELFQSWDINEFVQINFFDGLLRSALCVEHSNLAGYGEKSKFYTLWFFSFLRNIGPILDAKWTKSKSEPRPTEDIGFAITFVFDLASDFSISLVKLRISTSHPLNISIFRRQLARFWSRVNKIAIQRTLLWPI